MTSTPNSSFIPSDNRHGAYDKTAHNTIGRRKSKRRSKRTPVPLLVRSPRLLFLVTSDVLSEGSRYQRRNSGVLVIDYNISCIFLPRVCLCVFIHSFEMRLDEIFYNE